MKQAAYSDAKQLIKTYILITKIASVTHSVTVDLVEGVPILRPS